MNQQSVETSASPEVHIEVQCDAKIQGWDQNQVLAESPEGMIELRQIENVVTLECNDDCAVFVPMGAQLHVRKIGSDGRLKEMRAPAVVGDVGGDFVVRNTAGVSIGSVGGDLSARGVTGNLSVRSVGGDFTARALTGDVSVSSVSGDLDLDAAELVSLATSAGGDANIKLRFEGGAHCAVNAGGDINCELPPGIGARIMINDGRGHRVLRVGDGAAEVALNCGGSANVRANGAERADEGGGASEQRGERVVWGVNLNEDISARVHAEIGRNAEKMAQKMQRQAERHARHAERQAQHAARHATRQAERAARRAERVMPQGRPPGFGFNFDFGGFGPDTPRPPQPPTRAEAVAAEPVSDQERMAILKMLEDKKITAEQAEQLLRALG